jgi:hypothetical protein
VRQGLFPLWETLRALLLVDELTEPERGPDLGPPLRGRGIPAKGR